MCIRIDTDVLLANLVYAKYQLGYSYIVVTFEELKSYLNFLYNTSSTYILSDLCTYRFRLCTNRFPDLYELIDANIIAVKDSHISNLSYFNSLYSKDFGEYLQDISKAYLTY